MSSNVVFVDGKDCGERNALGNITSLSLFKSLMGWMISWNGNEWNFSLSLPFGEIKCIQSQPLDSIVWVTRIVEVVQILYAQNQSWAVDSSGAPRIRTNRRRYPLAMTNHWWDASTWFAAIRNWLTPIADCSANERVDAKMCAMGRLNLEKKRNNFNLFTN